MPTSTIWRRSAENTFRRAGSPIRPTGDAIERISPEPSFPTFSDAAYLATPSYYSHDTVQGLGLTHSGLLDVINGSRHSRDIFSEQNEKASTFHRGRDARTHPDRNRSPPREWSYHQSGLNGTYRQSKAKVHTRSGSTIDDLASAAIATDSPQMVNGSPRAYYHNTSPTTLSPTRPSTSHLTYSSRFEGIYEPPAKRIKSERIPAMEWTNNGSRPATSYDQSLTLDEDVKLLLGLRTAVNFKTQPSPLQQTAQLYQSPTPRIAELHSQDHMNSTTKQLESSSPHMASEKKPQVDAEVSAQVEAVVNDIERQEQIPNGVLPDEMELDAIPAEPAVDADTATLSVPDLVSIPVPSVEVKRTRRIKPQIQAEVCSECGKFQREADSGNLGITWIECSACSRWFHANCVGLNGKGGTRTVDTFICKKCEPEHGQTTFVRTSSRARTAIDYAELNQGLVKSSIETSMHHYITPIKQNKFTIQKDDFARVRPELLTVEFMESFDNMKRPFVVPADWNPRFGAARPADLTSGDREPPKERRFDSAGRETEPDLNISNDVATDTVIDCDQDLLDMVMPRDLTVRKVAELYGKHEFVPVIDVKSQETKGQWTLEQWADYYENQEEKPIRNVISLEVSESPIGRLIRRPKVVRDLDLEDHVWDGESRGKQKKRAVQYYCLMSVADSYTDFHIDFGGSAVYYHILKGTKTFFFIPPEDRYLKKYEEWCNSVTQNDIWLPDLCNGAVTRIDLHEGDTAFIPAGWIHSVWTPEDSLVIGGNYLTRIDYELQLKVANVEKVTNVAAKFRYPFFQKVMWYALIKYLDDDPVPEDVLADFEDSPDYTFLRANPVWHEIGELVNTAEPGSPEFNSRYYPKSEVSGLKPLRDYLYRTARVVADLPVPDINKKQIDAVKNSVPKGHGDPLVLIKTFAIWCAWKIGGVTAPDWVHSDDGGFTDAENKMKKNEAVRLPPERTSLRRAAQNQAQEPLGPAAITPHKSGSTAIVMESDPAKKVKPSSSPPSSGRSACDACRKRRVRCSHKEATGSPSNSDDVDVSTNGTFVEPQTLAPALDGITSVDTVDGSLPSSSLAKAALGNVDTQAYWDPNFRTLNGVVASAAKKSRTKACEECRKSKRRCVHDEYGRVDPAKAAEPSKPRGSSGTKRQARPSDEHVSSKRLRVEEDIDSAGIIDALIDPALFEQAVAQSDDAMQIDGPSELPDVDLQDGELAESIETGTEAMLPAAVDQGQRSVPDSPALMKQELGQAEINGVDEREVGSTTPVLEEVLPDVKVEHEPGVTTQTPWTSLSPLQRHSSRQTKQVERYVPDNHRSPTKAPVKPVEGKRRASSAASVQTAVTNTKSRRSSSNTSGTIHRIQSAATVKQEAPPNGEHLMSRGSTEESEDADEKLARELQAAEHGLRRRQSMRLSS